IDRGWCTGDRRKRAKRHHASEIADWALAERNAGQLFVSVPIVLLLAGDDRLGFRHGKEPTTLRQLLRTVAIAEETVIADPLKIAGWDMNEKSPDELLGADCHRLLLATATIVLTWGASGQGAIRSCVLPAHLVGSVSTFRSLSASVDISPLALGSENGEHETRVKDAKHRRSRRARSARP